MSKEKIKQRSIMKIFHILQSGIFTLFNNSIKSLGEYCCPLACNASSMFSLTDKSSRSKDISKERLVVVVSHNEKYNELYADYTVELEDGNVKECNLRSI